MNPPTLKDILEIYGKAEGRFWFRNDDGDTLSVNWTDEVVVGGKKAVRTTTHDFIMKGLNVKWVREVVVRVPRSGRVDIRGEARVKYEGQWDFTPDLVQARLGIAEPS